MILVDDDDDCDNAVNNDDDVDCNIRVLLTTAWFTIASIVAVQGMLLCWSLYN